MATFESSSRPRKSITTYGKPSRKRLAGHSYTALAHRASSSDSPKRDPPSIHETAFSDDGKTTPLPQSSIDKTASSKSQRVVNIYDVPLSDDEDPPLMRKNVTKSIQRPAQKSMAIRKHKVSTTTETINTAREEVQERKRRKLSPVEQPAQGLTKSRALAQKPSPIEQPPKESAKSKTLPQKSPTGEQLPIDAAKFKTLLKQQSTSITSLKPRSKQNQKSPSKRPVTPVASVSESKQRNKRQTENLHGRTNGELAQQSPAPASPPANKTSLPTELASARHISPKGTRMWDALLDEAQGDFGGSTTDTNEELSLFVTEPKKVVQALKAFSKPTALKKTAYVSPRKRLIDSLAEQRPHNAEEEETSGSDSEDVEIQDPFHHLDVSRAQSPSAEDAFMTMSAPASQSSQVLGPKITYSRQRSMLAEEDMMAQLAFELPLDASHGGKKARRGSIPSLKPLSGLREEDDTEEGPAGSSIRTIHELRQAGANSRFADEVEDLLDRIGNPAKKQLSMRRSGLLDLANKMKDKSFIRQFRSHGAEQRLFVDVGQEADIISGFLLVSLILPILAEGNISLIVGLLQRQDVSKLLVRQLNVGKSVVAVAKERRTNMSKVAQSAIIEYHNYLLGFPVWKDLQPSLISPRTLALKCVELMIRQSREAGDTSNIISKDLTSSLFENLKFSGEDVSWDLPSGAEAIDFYLTLSALEYHSLVARTTQDEKIWVRNYLPIVGHTLNDALKRPIDSFGEQQLLALRLTLNATSHNSKACDAIGNADLMLTIARITVANFKNLANLWAEEDIIVAVDHLILLLGTMINIAAWSTRALENLDSSSCGDPNPLDDLIQLFVDMREKTFEADSQHETQKNVPFGYLCVLLGYFALLPAIEERIRKRQTTKTIRPLITSIQQFVDHNKAVDNAIAADADGHNPHIALTEQFEGLVKKLLGVGRGFEKV